MEKQYKKHDLRIGKFTPERTGKIQDTCDFWNKGNFLIYLLEGPSLGIGGGYLNMIPKSKDYNPLNSLLHFLNDLDKRYEMFFRLDFDEGVLVSADEISKDKVDPKAPCVEYCRGINRNLYENPLRKVVDLHNAVTLRQRSLEEMIRNLKVIES